MNWPCTDSPGDFACCSECGAYLRMNGDCACCGLNFQTFVPIPVSLPEPPAVQEPPA